MDIIEVQICNCYHSRHHRRNLQTCRTNDEILARVEMFEEKDLFSTKTLHSPHLVKLGRKFQVFDLVMKIL